MPGHVAGALACQFAVPVSCLERFFDSDPVVEPLRSGVFTAVVAAENCSADGGGRDGGCAGG
jgi:hypothetical protein